MGAVVILLLAAAIFVWVRIIQPALRTRLARVRNGAHWWWLFVGVALGVALAFSAARR